MLIFFKGFHFAKDGPGNRLVYHLQGCNMHCPWCSNPEGMPLTGGEEVSVSAIVKEALSCRPIFFSGGGVTFTGGEATLQADELCEALRRLREAGIHTAIETNGTSPALPVIQENVDYLIMDVKHCDGTLFHRYTGVRIDTLRKNFAYLTGIRRQLHIRIPLIHHVNADLGADFADYFAGFPTESVVFEILPYHEYGKDKWKGAYEIKDGFVSERQIRDFESALKARGLRVVHT